MKAAAMYDDGHGNTHEEVFIFKADRHVAYYVTNEGELQISVSGDLQPMNCDMFSEQFIEYCRGRGFTDLQLDALHSAAFEEMRKTILLNLLTGLMK